MSLAEPSLDDCLDCAKVLDVNGNILSFNSNGLAAMEISDFSLVEGVYWPSIWPGNLREDAQKALDDARDGRTGTFHGLCPTLTGMPKWWDVLVTALPGRAGPAARFLVISRDVTVQRTQEKAARQLREETQRLNERLTAVAGASAEVLWDIDLTTGQVWWSEGMYSEFGYGPEQVGPDTAWCEDHMHPDDRERVTESMRTACESGATLWQAEFRYRKADGSYCTVADRGTITRDASGRAVRFLGAMRDITARLARETRQKLLSEELAHRISNTLSVVHSLVVQTAKRATDVPAFANQLATRIAAMANANRSLVAGNWAEADFEDLAMSQLAPFLDDAAQRINLSGPNVAVGMESAQALALALNELATNAAKYGALSVHDGRVALTWSVNDGATLSVKWEERGGPPFVPPGRTGLGSMLIDHGIPNASVERRFDPDGLTCSIRLVLTKR